MQGFWNSMGERIETSGVGVWQPACAAEANHPRVVRLGLGELAEAYGEGERLAKGAEAVGPPNPAAAFG
jgi:hypothetical protein